MENESNENKPEVSVIMPCLNEEMSVGICIDKCFRVFDENGINGEVVVADNGSVDLSREIVLKSRARLADEPKKGYGNAYLRGFSEARGKYLIMGDSDDTYDFSDLKKFIDPLKSGYDFVIGTRLKGKIEGGDGTMPWLHRFVGNPVLTFILRTLFKVNLSDVYCGMRSMTREAYEKLHLQATGMEYALEMIINTKKAGLKVKEVPIEYGLRRGESKLRTFRDGWRSLRFMLIYSPTYLFLVPGLALFMAGFLIMSLLIRGPVVFFGLSMDFHVMFLGSMMMIVGYQIINLGFFAKIYSFSEKFEEEKSDKVISFIIKRVKLEEMIMIGAAAIICGAIIFGDVFIDWREWMRTSSGVFIGIRKMVPAFTLIILGFQNIFFGFYYSILKIEKK